MKRLVLAFMAFIIPLCMFAFGCNRRAELATREVGNTPSLRVIHSVPNGPPFDVYLDESPFAQDLAFGGTTEYRDVEAGSHKVTLYPYGTTVNPVLNTDVRLTTGNSFTLLAIGRLEEIKHLTLRDADYTPPSDKAGIRFVNAIPDAPDLDLRVTTTDTTLIKAVEFGEVSRYAPLGPGVYEFGVNIGNLQTTITRLPNVQILEGRTYAVVAQGELTINTADVKVFEEKQD